MNPPGKREWTRYPKNIGSICGKNGGREKKGEGTKTLGNSMVKMGKGQGERKEGDTSIEGAIMGLT